MKLFRSSRKRSFSLVLENLETGETCFASVAFPVSVGAVIAVDEGNFVVKEVKIS